MKQKKWKRVAWKVLEIREIGAIIPLMIAFILFTSLSDKFLAYDNLLNVMRNASFNIICGIGMGYLLITARLDLALGATYSMGGVLVGIAMMQWGLPIWLSIIIAVLAGGLVGACSATFIEKVQLPPFIATTGMQFVVKGLVQGITRGNPVYPLPDAFLKVGQEDLVVFGLKIPWLVVIAVVMSVIAGLVLKYTTYGRRLYAIGGNGEAARLAGIPSTKLYYSVFILCGMLAAFAGVLQASRLGSAQTTVGVGIEGTIIAAAVIGGISMGGGVGSILGMVLGSFFMALITNGMTLIKISAYWQVMVTGIMLLIACSLDYIRKLVKTKLSD